MVTAMRVLLTGATGYIGGRLLPRLIEKEYSVRCLLRRPENLRYSGTGTVEAVAGDVLDPESLRKALRGMHTAYYLVHSMGAAGSFEERDSVAARNFIDAAAAEGVGRVIYLGGLAQDAETLSPHLRSRLEVGNILRSSSVVTIELRASIILGSGSLSFEMVRALVERLPVMIAPKWVETKSQPIAVDDVIRYLLEAIVVPARSSQVFEIGGEDQVSYGDLMREYARQRNLRRLLIPVPILTPRLSSLWLGLVTPLYARIGRKLIDSIRNETIVKDRGKTYEAFRTRPIDFRSAIRLALRNEDREFAHTRWSDAISSVGEPAQWGGTRFGTRLVDSRTRDVEVPPSQAFAPIQRIGGRTGWYYGNWLWRLRGWIDIPVGGVGLRRGRRHPMELSVGDPLDCWRVEKLEPGRLLRLQAEMKVPGRAWLEFEVTPQGNGSRIRQTAIFDPKGLAGLLYWYGIYPLHVLIFRGMLNRIAKFAEGKLVPPGTIRALRLPGE